MGLGGIDLVVGGFTDQVDAEGNELDAEAWGGMAPLLVLHRMLLPLIASPEKLSDWSQWLRH
ncbi:hypothetical protein ACS0TY_016595 [Phlomoides rotata]